MHTVDNTLVIDSDQSSEEGSRALSLNVTVLHIAMAISNHYCLDREKLDNANPVLEITVGHWPFFNQFQHLAD